MDFFNSLSQVVKNRENFKKWEQDQRDTEAKRQELYNRRQYTPEEIEEAKQFGERIIDVVDIMDNHSENVAENVETAVSPLVSLAPLLATLGTGAYYIKKIAGPAGDKIWEIEKEMLWNNQDVHKLADDITNKIHETRPNKEGFYSWHFLNKRKIDKIPDAKLKARAMEIYTNYTKKVKPYKNKIKGGAIGVAASSVLAFIGATIYAAKLQIDSSKIARYQARKILEDPKAFVNYTPEQIAAAKKYIEEHPELKKQKKKEKLKSGIFKSIINIFRDRKEYLKAKKADTDTSKKVTRTLTPEEIVQAKKDKEVIQRSVRLINNEAEKYSENMEVAAGVIMGSTPIVGGFFGWLTGLFMNKTGMTDRIVKNIVDKHGTEEAKAAYARFKEIKPGAPGYSVRWSKFVKKLMDNDSARKKAFEIAEDNADRVKTSKKDVFGVFKKMFAAGMSHRWGNSKIIGLIGALVSSIPAALIALKLQKSSARAGRYTAKRELEKDPRNFIGYTEEDLQEVKDVKGKKETFGQKLKEYAMFVPTVLKQYYAYEKYKLTEFKEHQLLLEQLQKSEVSEEQLNDAKNLQRKLFNTFEKVDDNSQIYSESMEAATEILQPFALSAGMLVMISPVLIAAIQIGRGKITAASAIDWTVKKLAGLSSFLKGKTFKKYLKDVSEKIPHKVGNIELENKPLAAMIQGIDFNNDKLGEIGSKLVKNLNMASDRFRYMGDREQVRLLGKIESSIKNLMAVGDISESRYKGFFENLLNIIKELKSSSYDAKLRSDMFDIMIKNTERVKIMSDERFKNAVYKYVDLACKSYGEDKIYRLANELATAPRETMDPLLAEFADKFTKNYSEYGMSSFDIKAFKKAITNSFDKSDVVFVYEKLDSIFKSMSDAFPYTLKEVPAGLDNIIEFLQKQGSSTFEKFERPALTGAVNETAESASGPIKGILKKLSDPKEYLLSFKKEVSEMTEVEFQNKADLRGFSSMDKKTMLSVISNLEKIYDNIPKEELAGIGKALLKELKEHPDEFMQALKSGTLATSLLTNGLVASAAAVGISWTALNIIIIWAVQTLLADMQLKAGRLGVMKAIESLDDPAYYANIIENKQPQKASSPSQSQEQPQPQPTKSAEQTSADNSQDTGNLLKKFKK